MQPVPGRRTRIPLANLGVILTLCIITFLPFAPLCSTNYQFINLDDDLYVTANPHVQRGVTLDSLWWNLTNRYSNHWHPLTWLSLQIDHELYSLEPSGYHRTNLLVHTANAALLFIFLRQTTASLWLSAVVAAFFAIHPLRVECVAWIADRKGVLSTFFWMLTMLAYAWYVRGPSWTRYAAVFVAFIAGLMSKPTLVTLPCVLLLLDYWPLRRLTFSPLPGTPGRGAGGEGSEPPLTQPLTPNPSLRVRGEGRMVILEKLPLLIVAVLFSHLFVYSQRDLVVSWEKLPWAPRLHNALVAYAAYIGKTLWPMDLGLHYPHALTTLPFVQVGAAAALLLVVTAFAILEYRRQPYLIVGWLWFLGTLVPVMGIVQLTDLAMADRWAYVPSIGLFIALVWTAAHYAERLQIQGLACLVGGLLLAACFALTAIQVGFWQDSVTVWERSLQVTEKNSLAHKLLGMAYLERGEQARAEYHLRKSIRLDPNDITAHHRLGMMLLENQRFDEAAPLFEDVIRVTAPHAPEVLTLVRAQSLNGLTFIHLRKQEFKKAEQATNEMLRLWPDDAGAHYNRGMALLGQKRYAEAVSALEESLELKLSSKEHEVNALNSIGITLSTHLNRPAEARRYFERALQIDPHNATAKKHLQ